MACNLQKDAMIFQPWIHVEFELSTAFRQLLKTFVHIESAQKSFLQMMKTC